MSLEDPAAVEGATTDPVLTPVPGTEKPAGGDQAVEGAKPAGTLADGAGEPDKPIATPADFPEDWREKLAGDNKQLLNTLKRYASPANWARAGFEAQQKIRSGEFKKGLSDESSPEEVAAWRKENGIPEKPEGYEVRTENGFVFGEADKPLLDSFKGYAHTKNWTPTQLNQAVEWYTTEQSRLAGVQAEADDAFKTDATVALSEQWGADFKRNVNAVANLFGSAPAGLADRLRAGRTSDGKVIGNDPEFLAWMAQVSRDLNPAASVVPAGTANQPKAIENRIAELKGLMGDQSSEYWKGPKAAGLQEEYRNLLEGQDRLRARAA